MEDKYSLTYKNSSSPNVFLTNLQWKSHKSRFKTPLAKSMKPECQNRLCNETWCCWFVSTWSTQQSHMNNLSYYQANNYAPMNIWPKGCPTFILLVIHIDNLAKRNRSDNEVSAGHFVYWVLPTQGPRKLKYK